MFRYKAYVMTSRALKKEDRLKRFDLKAWIGYLVRYDSSNIYRIWNHIKNKVFRARDVIFNKEEVFDRNIETLRDDLKEMSLEDLANLLKSVKLKEQPKGSKHFPMVEEGEEIREIKDDAEIPISNLDLEIEGGELARQIDPAENLRE